MQEPSQTEKIKTILQVMDYPSENLGYTLKEIKAVEQLLETLFPPALREFYLQMGRHPLFQDQEGFAFNLVPLELMVESIYKDEEGDEYVIIFDDNSGYTQKASIKKSSLDKDILELQYICEGIENWGTNSQDTHEVFSNHLVELVFQNIYLSFRQTVNFESSEETENYLDKNFLEIPFSGCYGDKTLIFMQNMSYALSPYVLLEAVKNMASEVQSLIITRLCLEFEDKAQFSMDLLKGIPIDGLRVQISDNEVMLWK
jgi:hypothetical protein